MAIFSIKDLASFSGIKPHTIRIWEQRYSFLQPQRSPTARRTYSTEELNVLLDVALMNQNGHKISRINKMSLAEKVQVLSQITDQQQKSIHDLIIAMANMNGPEFEAALDKSIDQWGIHGTILKVMLPFSEMIGLLQLGGPKAYAENILLVVQYLKQKLYLGIQDCSKTISKGSVVLFQPTGETEAISLLYIQYLLRKEGFTPLHLGLISMEHLQLIYRQTKPSILITHVAKRSAGAKKIEEFANGLECQKERPVFIFIENKAGKKDAQYRYAPSILDAIDMVDHKL